MQTNWTKNSWRAYPALQQPEYSNSSLFRQTLKTLKGFDPLVCSEQVQSLRAKLALVQKGELFLLHIGDCVERFSECSKHNVHLKMQLFQTLSKQLSQRVQKPVLVIGRIAGQYSKPRSLNFEQINGHAVGVFKGEAINAFESDPRSREPDPSRLIQSYEFSKRTLDYIKGFQGDLILGNNFFCSHEGLLLDYEESFTHQVQNDYYNLGTHLLWIGERTRQVDGAHVAYHSGIYNPIAVKVGPNIDVKELIELAKILNPQNIPGKLHFITRLGAENVESILPKLIKSLSKENLNLFWSVDPMHGNTQTTSFGVKTRSLSLVAYELRRTIEIHAQLQSRLSGIHLEATAQDVTECLGGSDKISYDDLSSCYESYCDPRLNPSQAHSLIKSVSF